MDSTPTCIHCDATLTPTDISTGWCDSCGKRLPSGARPAARPAAVAAAPAPAAAAPARGSSWVAWGVMALVALVVVGIGSVVAFAR
jgi:hypothetical protein